MSFIAKAVSKTVKTVARVATGVVKTAISNPELILAGALTGGGIAAVLGKSIVKGAIAGGVVAGATGAIARQTVKGNALFAAAESIGATSQTPPATPTPSDVALAPAKAPITGATTAQSAPSAPSAQPYFAPSPAQHITVNAPIAPTPPVRLPQIQASSPSIAGQRSKVGSSAGVHTSSQGVAPAPVSALSGVGSSIVSNQNRRKKII